MTTTAAVMHENETTMAATDCCENVPPQGSCWSTAFSGHYLFLARHSGKMIKRTKKNRVYTGPTTRAPEPWTGATTEINNVFIFIIKYIIFNLIKLLRRLILYIYIRLRGFMLYALKDIILIGWREWERGDLMTGVYLIISAWPNACVSLNRFDELFLRFFFPRFYEWVKKK